MSSPDLAARAALLALLIAAPAWAADAAAERSAGGHRWHAPVWISAPATSMLALAGMAGLAAHLFRRRRKDGRKPPPARSDDDWDERLAMWERRISGDDRLQRRRPDEDDGDDHKPI